MDRAEGLPGQTRSARRASVAGALTAVVLALLIFIGSDGLRTFDAALIGYATATVVLAFGVVYRYAMWVQQAPTRRYFVRGWRRSLVAELPSVPDPRPERAGLVPGAPAVHPTAGRARWLAHLAIFWGVVLATLMTFALSWGWIHFEADSAGTYQMFVWRLKVLSFAPFTWFSWLVFHLLDIAALLVIAGCGYFLWRRVPRSRGPLRAAPRLRLPAAHPADRDLGHRDAAHVLERAARGAGYEFLAILHMGVVVLSLVFIPFGKFFHVIQRPAVVGVRVFKQVGQADEGIATCRRCGEPLESAAFVRNLQETMDELDLRYRGWIETCPRCKRVRAGQAYLHDVKRGF